MNELMRYKERSGLSFTAMAQKAGVPIPTLWRHAVGDRQLSLKFALLYSKKFRIPISKLGEETDDDS